MIDLYSDGSSDAEWEPIFVLVAAAAVAVAVVVLELACVLDCVSCWLSLTMNC